MQIVSDKEVLSGWQRCKILSKTDNQVTVEYLDDEEENESLTYDISCFVASATPAPSHVIDLTENVQSSVSHEQSVFVMKERVELLPLQKKKVFDPSKWIKNQRKLEWTVRFGEPKSRRFNMFSEELQT